MNSYLLIVIVIAAGKILNALCDIISNQFETHEENNIKITSRRKTHCLVFCLFLYLATALPLFWKRFEVILVPFIRSPIFKPWFYLSIWFYLILKAHFFTTWGFDCSTVEHAYKVERADFSSKSTVNLFLQPLKY